MLTFIMLTRLSPEAARSPQALEQLEFWGLTIIWMFSAPRTSKLRAKFRR